MKFVSISEVSQSKINHFSCLNDELDKFLKRNALKNDINGYGKTFILESEKEIIGFFTLCSFSVKFDEYPNKENFDLPRYPIPCIKIARLAVNNEYQRKGYGKQLLKEAFLRILSVSKEVGIRMIVVDAKESAVNFYTKFGFEPFSNEGNSYYLLVDTLVNAID